MRTEAIAIVGIGCRFPGGVRDPRGFWDMLVAGTDAIVDVPADRWDPELFYDPDPRTPGKTTVRQGGFLTTPIDEFDADFFGMTPREAAPLDPQQRMLLEVAWEALEDAGIPPGTLAGANVGTYIGGFMVDALHLMWAGRELAGSHHAAGANHTMLSARLAHAFDWRGPCLTIDTACSSSLVALHYAVTAIANGECDMAVTGGVNLIVNPTMMVAMSKGQFLSPDARCKTFDHRANGYARGEGAGLLVLKRLSSAERDGDRVYAVIRGTAVNQDGRTPGITVPSGSAQLRVIHAACRSAGAEPDSIGYFEAHGTGTPVGDPIEANAIGEAIGSTSGKRWISSVKTNIGHLEAAAGVAGVIKAALCLERGLIPPHLHLERPNPAISFESLPLRVPTELVPFDGGAHPRRAGVNSFGFGGTNAHAVLEQAPPSPHDGPAEHGDEPLVLPISARSAGALRTLADAYATLLDRPDAPGLRRVCRAVSRGREHLPLRAFVVADGSALAAERLRGLDLDGEPARAGSGGTVFVYSGMGPQWWGMGRELLREEPLFAEVVAECDRVLAGFGLSMAEEFQRDEASSLLTRTLYAQVGNFVLQAGLTRLWRSWGVEPAAVVGHSVGEVAAAYAAGVYSLEDALTISFHRASLQARTAGRAAMLAVGLPADELEPMPERVSVAAVNSPTTTTLAGDRDALDEVTARLSESGVYTKALRVEVAYHSHHMDAIREPLLAALRDIRPRPAEVPLYSTVTGDRVEGTELDAGYWWRNVRQPVLFAAAIRELAASGPNVVLEVGPHPVLASAIVEAVAPGTAVIASQRRERPQRQTLREALGELYTAGGHVDWELVHPGPREHIALPSYPWQRQRHWSESTASRSMRLGAQRFRLAAREIPAPVPTWETEVSLGGLPYLGDHRVGDTVVFPGAGYVEAALAVFDQDAPCVLENVVFHRPLVVEPATLTVLRTTYDPDEHEVSIHARGVGADTGWTRHASFRHSPLADHTPPVPYHGSLATRTESLPETGADEIYTRLSDMGLPYGPSFRRISRAWFRQETAEVFAELDTDLPGGGSGRHRLHPALLDAAFQVMLVGWRPPEDTPAPTFVMVRIDRLRFFRSPGERLWIHNRVTASEPGRIGGDLTLVTDGGEVVAELTGVVVLALADDTIATTDTTSDQLYCEHMWRPDPPGDSGPADGDWLVVGNAGRADELARALTDRGAQVRRVVPQGDWLRDVQAALPTDQRGVVFVHTPDHASEDAACAPCTPVLGLLRVLSTQPLFLVTDGAQNADEREPTTDPAGASLWGLARVVCAERPELRCRLIDTDTSGDALVDELVDQSAEDVVLRGGERFVRRLERADRTSVLHHVQVRCGETPVRLSRNGEGLSGLGFVAAARRAPEAEEVEIAISHTGLNFKDLSNVMGLLAPEALEGTHSAGAIGVECSGTVVRAGSSVSDLRPGDEVFVLSKNLLASHVTLDHRRVVRKPDGLSFAQAAALFPALTAYTALVHVANLRPGERVLVQSGAGGVGLAAIRVAKWLGAEVFATAGSERRREFLRAEGVTAVFDSRSTSFADELLAHTGGEGVDVVLSALPGEMLEKGLGLLRPFGRYVDLGKADAAADRKLRLGAFNRSISFHAFDYDRLMHLDPERVRGYMNELAQRCDEGAFAPLPVVELPAGELSTAFRRMAQGEYIGKIVVAMADAEVRVPARSMPAVPLRPDGTYLVTGGLSGFGLETAKWLAAKGARHLLLVSRRGVASSEAERVVHELRESGIGVHVEKADITRREVLADVLATARRELQPLRGVVHSAAAFDDAPLEAMSEERFLAATAPKADGAWHLHRETAADQLDFFVLYSSCIAQTGASALGPYAAANEFLNGLARYRRGLGLPAMSVNWGAVAEAGIAARSGVVADTLQRNGQEGLTPARLLAELETLLRTDPVEVSVAGVRWDRWARANAHLARLPRFASLMPEGGVDAAEDAALPERLRAATRDERIALLGGPVRDLFARVTGLADDQLDGGQAVAIDSLTGVELRVLVQSRLGVAVPVVKLQQNLTVTTLVSLLADLLDQVPASRGLATAHEFVSAEGTTVSGTLSLPEGRGPHPAVVVCTDVARREPELAALTAARFAVFVVGGDDVVAAGRGLAQLPEIDEADVTVLTDRVLPALERFTGPGWRVVVAGDGTAWDDVVASLKGESR
jgi:acyl transferase domain-containing protein